MSPKVLEASPKVSEASPKVLEASPKVLEGFGIFVEEKLIINDGAHEPSNQKGCVLP
jgi:hypothetical protein